MDDKSEMPYVRVEERTPSVSASLPAPAAVPGPSHALASGAMGEDSKGMLEKEVLEERSTQNQENAPCPAPGVVTAGGSEDTSAEKLEEKTKAETECPEDAPKRLAESLGLVNPGLDALSASEDNTKIDEEKGAQCEVEKSEEEVEEEIKEEIVEDSKADRRMAEDANGDFSDDFPDNSLVLQKPGLDALGTSKVEQISAVSRLVQMATQELWKTCDLNQRPCLLGEEDKPSIPAYYLSNNAHHQGTSMHHSYRVVSCVTD